MTNHCFFGDGIIHTHTHIYIYMYVCVCVLCPILDSHGRAEAPTIKASASSTCQAFCDEVGQGVAPEGQAAQGEVYEV